MQLLTTTLLMLFGGLTMAQQVSGYVTLPGGTPISHATVTVLGSGYTVLSDSAGYYMLMLHKGSFVIEIRHLGYASLAKDVYVQGDSMLVNFVLQAKTDALNDVIIMANKSPQHIADVPISVTALSAERIQDTRTWSLEDLRGLVPNYQYANLGVSYQQMQAIRGISVFSENSAVATYIDGVSALDVTGNGLELTDIESIEILRGPQGTLYGRNAMGGVLNIKSRQPTNKSTAYIELSTGNQGLQRYAAAFKTPLIRNTLFVSATVQYLKQFGFYFNDLSDKMTFDGRPLKGTEEDGQRMGDAESLYANMFLKWLVSANLQLSLNTKLQLDQSTGPSMYYQAVENEVTAIAKPYKMAVNSLGSHKRFVSNTSLAVTYAHTKFTLVSVSAFQRINQYYSNIDQDLYPYSLATGSTYHNAPEEPIPQNVLSQELRISSATSGKKLNWIAGTYMFYQAYDKRYATHYDKLALLFGEIPGVHVSQNDERNKGLAVFGQASYEIAGRWGFTMGLRYDLEHRFSTLAKFRIDSVGYKVYSQNQTNRMATFHALSPKAAVTFKVNASHNLYFSYARGFRAGGINTASNVTGYDIYKPEYSDNVEVGYKYRSSNSRYSAQAAVFYLYWQNLQLDLRTNSGVYVIHNIGNVQAFGLEIEAMAVPFKGFTVEVAIGYNHSRYQNFEFLGRNIKGNKTILAPPITMFTALQYQITLPKNFALLFRSECRYVGEQYFDLINSIKQSGYYVLNGRVELKFKTSALSFWVQNVTNSRYITYAMPGYFRYTILNRPRQLGTTLRLDF